MSLTISAGEIYGLIGPNGAGKTTFFNVLTGLYHRAIGGDVIFDGERLQLGAPHEVAKPGIARTFQNIRLFANMTALENVMVGRHVRTQRRRVRRRPARSPHARRGSGHPPPRRTSCCTTSASPPAPTTWPGICPTATSAGWKSPARWPPSRSCWRSTSRRPA